MNLQDLLFVDTTYNPRNEIEVRLNNDSGDLVGYIKFYEDIVTCWPASLTSQEVLWDKILDTIYIDSNTTFDDVLIEYGKNICNYHNELAFLKQAVG